MLVANGSSAVGRCSSVTLNWDRPTSTCNNPASSVLFDRNTPILAALDGNTWASQFMIFYRPEFGSSSIYSNIYNYFDFPGTSGSRELRRVEVTIFNCPHWGTGVEYIRVDQLLTTTSYRVLARVFTTVLSCTSLLRVCIPFEPTTSSQIRLYFDRYNINQMIHVAEIAFYRSSSPCPPFTTLPGRWTPPQTSSTQSHK